MRARLAAATLVATLAFPIAHPLAAQALRLPKLFGDGMVMQRGARVPVWGWAAPGQRVTVVFDGRARTATADARGRWTVALPAMRAGGPHAMSVAAGADRREVRDILVGDVWIASGQSNIEWPVSAAKDAAREIAAANDPAIRHFKVPTSWADRPEDDLAGGDWRAATPKDVGSFSAVAYFFARDLRARGPLAGVPIGIINTSWGGSRIEPWMSREALGLDEAALAEARRMEQARQEQALAAIRAKIGGTIPTTDSGLVNGQARWADPALDDGAWAPVTVPGLWETQGYEGMDGTAWLRASFTLSADEAARGVRLGLGQIDDDDVTWVNGVQVGATRGYNVKRVYDVPPAALRAGRNVVAVRVQDGGGGGGIHGAAADVFLEVPGTNGGARRPLGGGWRMRVGAVSVQPDGQVINKRPTVLWNKMVHPILPFPITGALWYQGESNADGYADAVAYRELFPKMIASWRAAWGVGDFPFLWVQLANFMAADSTPPARSNWAALRESQSAALSLPNAAQAVIIDLGEAADIHPTNKQDVGARLAAAARRVAYGDTKVVASGPRYRAHRVEGARVIVELDGVGGGLVAKDQPLAGFAIAGADGRFVWADARIERDRVVVWSDRVPAPLHVRYAWGNNPAAGLYNREGFPATPFRTDAW